MLPLPSDLQDIYEQLIKTVSDETFKKCKQSGIDIATGKWKAPLSWKKGCVLELRTCIRQYKHLCAEDKSSQAELIIHIYYYCSTLLNETV